MPFLQLENEKLYYEVEGESGSPVLLIMGFGVPGRMWRNQSRFFKKSHRVVWFDNCGVGNTESKRRIPYRTKDLAAHSVEIMNHLGWDNAHVVGVSMGGMIAQELALQWPQRVRSLSLLVTHGGGMKNLIPTFKGVSLFVKGFLGPKKGRAKAMEKLIFPPDFVATNPQRERLENALENDVAMAAPTKDRLSQMTVVFSHYTKKRLRRLQNIPTLVISAAKDILVRPDECRKLAELIPGAKLVEFPEAGHGIMHQCSRELNTVLVEHFNDVDQNYRDVAESNREIH